MKAVILAGGRGERVSPITETLPKPLIPINGKPIIAHQLAQLERIGFKEVIILTGYLASSVKSYCDSLGYKLRIICIESDPDDSPAQRLNKSKSQIGNHFLLIYCDNYILADTDIINVLKSETLLTFLIEPRAKGNISIEGNRTFYNSGPRSSGNKFVELGNIRITSGSFWKLLEKIENLPLTLEVFSKENESSSIEITSGFWSISNLSRYLEIITNRKLVLLDRDGVLLEKMPKRKYVSTFEEYMPMYENWEGLRKIGALGVDFIVATNQPGVATGAISESFLLQLHQRLVSDLLNFGVNILAVYACKHHWDDKCECRKPEPGMLLNAMSDFRVNKNQTLYIGDDDRDLLAAQAACIEGLLIGIDHTSEFDYPNVASAHQAISRAIGAVE